MCAHWWSREEVGGESSWFGGCKWNWIVFLVGGWSCLACLALDCLLPEVGGPAAYGCDAAYVRWTKKRRSSQNQLDSLSLKNIFKSFLHLWLTVTFPLQSHACNRMSSVALVCVRGCAGCCLCVRTEDNAFCLSVFRPWNCFIPANAASLHHQASVCVCVIGGGARRWWRVNDYKSVQTSIVCI